MIAASDVLDRLRVRGELRGDQPSLPPSRQVTDAAARALLHERNPLLSPAAVDCAVAQLVAEVSGLGPIECLLSDAEVSEIMANGDGLVWVERRGVLARTDVYLSRDEVQRTIDRMILPLGLRLDRLSPMVDARLEDGSRVHAVLPPLAVDGPYLTVRRFRSIPLTISDLADSPHQSVLRSSIADRCSMLVYGPTGSGKTTLLNALGGLLDPHERIVVIEDTAELRLPGDHVVRLECRPASIEGLGGIDMRALVRAALRMRPDRIVVGEVRGPEAFDLVQAHLTGHSGGMATIHARGSVDALRRLETLVLLAGSGLSDVAVRRQIAAAFDVVIGIERRQSGSRAVHTVERIGLVADEFVTEPLTA